MKNRLTTQTPPADLGAIRGQLIRGPWKPRNAKVSRRRKLPECIEWRPRADGSLPYRVHLRINGVRDFSGHYATLKEAVTARDERRAHARKLRVGGVNDGVTVADAIAGYRTSDAYKNLANKATTETRLNYWQAELGGVLLADLPGHTLAAERDRLVRKKTAASTVCGYLSALSCAWNWAHEGMGAVSNQVTTIRWPKIKRERPRKFTAKQLQHVLKRADSYKGWRPLGLLVRLSLLTTQRKITVLSPRWHQVDLDSGTIEIPAIKNGRAMSLVIEGETLTLLRAHARRTGAKPGDYVFQSPVMPQPMDPKKHIDWLFNDPALVDANGKRLTFKHLRSTTMSRLFTHLKVDLPRAMAITGHKTARVLLEHYAHADTEENRAIIREHHDKLLGG